MFKIALIPLFDWVFVRSLHAYTLHRPMKLLSLHISLNDEFLFCAIDVVGVFSVFSSKFVFSYEIWLYGAINVS